MIYRRGEEHVVVLNDDGEVVDEFNWARCEITNCPNNVCLGMSKSLCYPHGIEFGEFTEEEFKANRARRHAITTDEPNQ